MYRFILLIPIGIVTMGVGLVKAALRKFVDEEKRIRLKPRPATSSVYVTDEELSQLVPSSDFSCLVGIDRQITAVVALLLDLGSKEVGIWGVQGVGKTTLARCVYQQISSQFHDHYYFVNDSENNSLGLSTTCLLESVTRSALTSGGSESLYEFVKARLGHKKVLLIVDGLYHIDQLKHIRKISRWFGPGSRLIFVTQQKRLLVRCEVKRIYEVETLRYDEALQLFSQFAFKQEHVPKEYHRLSVRAVLITGRIPLALKVFGSFLRGKFSNEWEFELCRLEASQDNCVSKVSGYIGNAFS